MEILNWLFALTLCVGTVEAASRMTFTRHIKNLSAAVRKASALARRRRVSDHWKEKAIGAYAKNTFSSTLNLAVLLFMLFGPVVTAMLVFDYLASTNFLLFITSGTGLFLTCVFASGYAAFKSRLKSRSGVL